MRLDGVLSAAMTSPLGRRVSGSLGLAEAATLRRGRTLPTGPVVLASVVATGDAPDDGLVAEALSLLGISPAPPVIDLPAARTTGEDGRERPPAYPGKIGALVVDARALSRVAELEQLRAVLRPAVKALETAGRVILVGHDPADATDAETAAVRQALDGLMRTVGKELRHGATCNLLQLAPASTAAQAAEPLRFLLEGRSAYVDGQPLRLTGPATTPGTPDPGRIVVVTGAARGIGAEIARTFGRDGARLVVVDVPQAGESLAGVANELHGSALQLDITVPEAGDRIAAHVTSLHGPDARIDVLVHCAGILRDKLLANLDEKRWAAVLEVNLAAPLRINRVLLDPATPGGLADGGAIVGVASTSGWAGNRGQGNYASSKAGIMGMVRALAPELAGRNIRVNAVAPGFIETDMTASIPFVEREIFKRSNSLAQAGKPVDVAEAVCFLAEPANPMNGQVLRVCGQLLVGA